MESRLGGKELGFSNASNVRTAQRKVQSMSRSTQDKWARWLLDRRYGGDAARRQKILDYLISIRNRVLDNARLSDGDVLLMSVLATASSRLEH